jgi:hypothetical protein
MILSEKERTMDDKPRLDTALVEEFVGKAHGDFNRVKEMLAQQPRLINAAWDWGNGDWETALGAAAHMGRRDIAEYLLAQGARLDIFAAAMLGRLEIVKAMIEAYPAMATALGPHGIPLSVHAEKGGEAAAPVMEFLNSL